MCCKVCSPHALNLHCYNYPLAMSFNVDKSNTKTVDIDKSFPIFDQSAQCGKTPGPTFKAELKVDVDAQAHATINYGIVANGTIVPPV